MKIDSGEVDVALEFSITGAFQQSKLRRALSRPGRSPDDDDDYRDAVGAPPIE